MENSLSKYIILTEENMAKEHICCAFSDKKCTAGYELKNFLLLFCPYLRGYFPKSSLCS